MTKAGKKQVVKGTSGLARGMATREMQVSYGPRDAEGPALTGQADGGQSEDRERLLDLIDGLRDVMSNLFGSFKPSELLASTQLQRSSYRDIETKLKAHGKLLFVYNSSPSAVLFDLGHLDELREDLECSLMGLERLASGKGEYTADQLLDALETNRPSE